MPRKSKNPVMGNSVFNSLCTTRYLLDFKPHDAWMALKHQHKFPKHYRMNFLTAWENKRRKAKAKLESRTAIQAQRQERQQPNMEQRPHVEQRPHLHLEQRPHVERRPHLHLEQRPHVEQPHVERRQHAEQPHMEQRPQVEQGQHIESQQTRQMKMLQKLVQKQKLQIEELQMTMLEMQNQMLDMRNQIQQMQQGDQQQPIQQHQQDQRTDQLQAAAGLAMLGETSHQQQPQQQQLQNKLAHTSHCTELLQPPNTEIREKLARNVFGRAFGDRGLDGEHFMHKATSVLLQLGELEPDVFAKMQDAESNTYHHGNNINIRSEIQMESSYFRVRAFMMQRDGNPTVGALIADAKLLKIDKKLHRDITSELGNGSCQKLNAHFSESGGVPVRDSGVKVAVLMLFAKDPDLASEKGIGMNLLEFVEETLRSEAVDLLLVPAEDSAANKVYQAKAGYKDVPHHAPRDQSEPPVILPPYPMKRKGENGSRMPFRYKFLQPNVAPFGGMDSTAYYMLLGHTEMMDKDTWAGYCWKASNDFSKDFSNDNPS